MQTEKSKWKHHEGESMKRCPGAATRSIKKSHKGMMKGWCWSESMSQPAAEEG
jgi:hypothetical protein